MNAVIKRLEGGKASVKGLKMLYPVTESSLFRVVVKGISFASGGCGCGSGPGIIISPVDGVGDMTVKASALVDDTAASRDAYFRRHEMQAWKRARHTDTISVVGLRNTVNEVLAGIKASTRKSLVVELPDRFTAEGTANSKLNVYELRRLLDRVLQAKFKIDDEHESES